ncbi:recombination protein RecR [Candidatus Gottesmanbacteria bacterium]|nr:recombination protein RecR [Candidatus Gottesmanbacteria bacterium]
MKILPKSIEKLIESFEKLPGIGPKTAQRLTFYLLHVPQHELDGFSEAIKNLRLRTAICSRCFNVGEEDPCLICSSRDRNESTIMVVESPIDVLAIERTGKYKGLYHVLNGVISPLQNIGPDEIRIAELLKRIKDLQGITELILATNSNMEGEATAMYILRECRMQNAECRITRLAQGLPVGGDLEYADDITLGHALEGRRDYT